MSLFAFLGGIVVGAMFCRLMRRYETTGGPPRGIPEAPPRPTNKAEADALALAFPGVFDKRDTNMPWRPPRTPPPPAKPPKPPKDTP